MPGATPSDGMRASVRAKFRVHFYDIFLKTQQKVTVSASVAEFLRGMFGLAKKYGVTQITAHAVGQSL